MSALRTVLGLVVLLVVALVFPEVASAKSVTGAETRVGVFNLDGQVCTGVEANPNAEHHRDFGDAEYDCTARSPHAAGGGARALPTIAKGSNREMLGQAVGHLKQMGGSAADKAAAFEGMAGQINKLSGGSWSAARAAGADGAHIFAGEFGEALVVPPSGALFRGNITKIGSEFGVGAGGKLQPIYSALKGL